MNKNLKGAKNMVLFVIIIAVINFIATIVYKIIDASNNVILIYFARFFPYISNLGQLAFNLAVLFMIIYLIKKNKENKSNKELYYAKILMIANCIIVLLGVLISTYLGISTALGNDTTALTNYIGYFLYLDYISSIAFYISIFLIIRCMIIVDKIKK
jgi:hypothetical protein